MTSGINNRAMNYPGAPAGLDAIPWSRIVHFYGRASSFPAIIRRIIAKQELLSDIAELAKIEHQDSVVQAAPFAMFCLMDHLRCGAFSCELGRICEATLKSARYQLSGAPSPIPLISLMELASENNLWPVFESDDVDEDFWEDWRPSEAVRYAWAAHTAAILESAGFE